VVFVKLDVTSRTEEPLLARAMVKATLEFEKSTPSYAEVTASLAASLKSDEKLVAIRHIYNSFGAKKADVIAYLYNDEAKKQLIEPKLKVKKEKKAKAAKK
jgi:ribosomal protein S24E